ncbi:MAG: helix-turn-helix transcriptional regulator [Bacteroidales bacterium]|nr:helix-turn-helix transcriptional regulator [Bacteroidales bacterium]
MHYRLQQFLNMENLSPARFAEKMGIQRSGVSHLLSGRNKPSFEFLQRMMTTFPDINYEWLVLGKGRPYKNDHPQPDPLPKPGFYTEPAESDTFENEELFPDFQEFDTEIQPAQVVENRVKPATATATPSESGKKIARIIVFFTDGTFEEK